MNLHSGSCLDSIASALQAGMIPVSAILILGATTGRWDVKVAEWRGQPGEPVGLHPPGLGLVHGQVGTGWVDTLGIVMGLASVLLCLGMGINPRELALDWRYVLPFCFVGVTVPLLFLQIGIRHVAPFVVVVMTNLNPILT